jgi:hypothetical protein
VGCRRRTEYQPLVEAFTAASGSPTSLMGPEDVARVVRGAATDGTSRLRSGCGDGATALLGQRDSVEQDEAFVAGMRARFGLSAP